MNYRDRIKAIVFDFDGTLIDFSYQTTEYTRRALDALKDRPYRICLSSGRPCHIAIHAFRKTFGDYPLDYVFGCNGAELKDMKSGRLEILNPLSAEEVQYIGKTVKCEHAILGIYEDDHFLVSREVTEPSLRDFQKSQKFWKLPGRKSKKLFRMRKLWLLTELKQHLML